MCVCLAVYTKPMSHTGAQSLFLVSGVCKHASSLKICSSEIFFTLDALRPLRNFWAEKLSFSLTWQLMHGVVNILSVVKAWVRLFERH